MTMTTATTVTEALQAMLALYATPGAWTREGVAWDAAGRRVPAASPEAVAWSLEGALERVIGDWEEPTVEWSECERRQRLLAGVYEACGLDLMALNDAAHHQGAVVGLMRQAKLRSA